jgi:TetR/AcrR family transcriptional regulator, mexJK operon transcriptional repressor
MNASDLVSPVGNAARIRCAARDVFYEQGYAAVSMDEVARRAGVAKQTVYSHFNSKDALFLAVVECEWQNQAALQLKPALTNPATAREGLRDVGLQLVEIILSPGVRALLRVTVAAAPRFPNLGRLYYEGLPQRRIVQLTDIMRRATDAGALRADDPLVAATHFNALIRGQLFLQCLLDPSFTPLPSEVIKQVEQAVDCFLARYGVSPRHGDGRGKLGSARPRGHDA